MRPGGPWRSWATRASVRWPTMSRPRRTHDRRVSSSRMPVDWSTAVARPPASPGASRTSSSVSARRASAASRWRRSATRAGVSRRGQATAGQVEDEQVDRATGEQAARDRQPLVEAGRRDDHEPLEPHAAGDRLDRVEAARQVEPGDDRALAPGPRRRPEGRASSARSSRRRGSRRWPSVGRPPGPRIASSAAKPVRTTRSSGSGVLAGGDRRPRPAPARPPGPAPRRPAELPHPSGPGGPRRRRPHHHGGSSSDG